jgi:hypothetical protein
MRVPREEQVCAGCPAIAKGKCVTGTKASESNRVEGASRRRRTPSPTLRRRSVVSAAAGFRNAGRERRSRADVETLPPTGASFQPAETARNHATAIDWGGRVWHESFRGNPSVPAREP